MAITAESVVTVVEAAPQPAEESGSWETTTDLLRGYSDGSHLEAIALHLRVSLHSLERRTGRLCNAVVHARSAAIEAVFDLTHRIFTEFKFDPTATCVNTPPLQVLHKRRGVLPRLRHLMIVVCSIARTFGPLRERAIC